MVICLKAESFPLGTEDPHQPHVNSDDSFVSLVFRNFVSTNILHLARFTQNNTGLLIRLKKYHLLNLTEQCRLYFIDIMI